MILNENTGIPDGFDVSLMTMKGLDLLSESQMRYVAQKVQSLNGEKIYGIIRKALEGKESEMISSLSREPYAYISHDIELIPGLKVQFRSLYTIQTRDVTKRTHTYINESRASDAMAANHMNNLFLCHGIESINGDPLGNANIPANIWNLDEEKKIEEAFNIFVNMRMKALLARPQSLISMLITANSAFQSVYDDVVNLRSPSIEESTAKARGISEAVGKSTGPQVAGQKPT